MQIVKTLTEENKNRTCFAFNREWGEIKIRIKLHDIRAGNLINTAKCQK